MSSPAARITDPHVCPVHGGGPILPAGCPTVLLGGLPAARVTDLCTCVGPPDIIVTGSTGVWIGGLPAARMGDSCAHGGVIAAGLPTVLIGHTSGGAPAAKPPAGGGAPGASAPAPGPEPIPQALPATVADAPRQIQLPANVNATMQKAFTNSFPNGKSQEQAGTLVRAADGTIQVVNEVSGSSGSVTPDRAVAASDTIVGTFHTHPYDASEGGHRGVSFSGGDIAYAKHFEEPVYVDAGDKQFMIMPTLATTATPAEINAEWNTEYTRLRQVEKQSIQDASASATEAVASKFGLAYYEGTSGLLDRVGG